MQLSPAEQIVYDHVVNNALPQEETAKQLHLAHKTIKFHLQNIFKKKNVKTTAQLILQHWKK